MLGFESRASAPWRLAPRGRRRDRAASFGTSIAFVVGAFAVGGGMALSTAYFA